MKTTLKNTFITALPIAICFLLAGCASSDRIDDGPNPSLGLGLGARLMSSTPSIEASNGGFSVKQRAGVDQLAGDPTWETIRRQKVLAAAKDRCPNGVASMERRAIPVETIEFGTSRDLTYDVRCK